MPGLTRIVITDDDGNITTNQISIGSKTTVAAGNSVTINTQAGYFTTATLTTAINTNQTITITNSLATANSIVVATIGSYSGTYGTNGVPVIVSVTPSAGSIAILVRNIDGTNALNGTLEINFAIF